MIEEVAENADPKEVRSVYKVPLEPPVISFDDFFDIKRVSPKKHCARKTVARRPNAQRKRPMSLNPPHNSMMPPKKKVFLNGSVNPYIKSQSSFRHQAPSLQNPFQRAPQRRQNPLRRKYAARPGPPKPVASQFLSQLSPPLRLCLGCDWFSVNPKMFINLEEHLRHCARYTKYRKELEIEATFCLICERGGREDQFLLCDRPDPWEHGCHSNCAGLGGIPKGDWHCQFHLLMDSKEARTELREHRKTRHFRRLKMKKAQQQ